MRNSQIFNYLEDIMATLDDLTASVGTLTTQNTAEKAAIDALLAFVATVHPGQLSAEQQKALDNANTAVQAVTSSQAAETTAVQGATPAAPAPTPTPAPAPTPPAAS